MIRLRKNTLRSRIPHQVTRLLWHDFDVTVTRKTMKSMRLSFKTSQHLQLSCPHFVTDSQIYAFLDERLDWINAQQQSQKEREQTGYEQDSQNEIWLWGEKQSIAALLLASGQSQLPKHGAKISAQKDALLRRELSAFITQQLPILERQMQVQSRFWGLRKMRTKWGSCNVTRQRIWLNVRLAHYPPECAYMVLVHELAHLLEPSHNQRFYRIMDKHMPNWRAAEQLLR